MSGAGAGMVGSAVCVGLANVGETVAGAGAAGPFRKALSKREATNLGRRWAKAA